MSADDLMAQVNDLDWYHTIDLGQGRVTPGMFDWRPFLGAFEFGDLRGKTVLDVGAGDGFFSFEMEKLGGRVTAVDIPSQEQRDGVAVREKRHFGTQDPGSGRTDDEQPDLVRFTDKFGLAKELLGSSVERLQQDLYTLSPDTCGTFDVVFCSDVLLHLTDPLRALSRMRAVCGERVIVNTPMFSTSPKHEGVEMAQFRGHKGKGTFWFPNRPCLEAWMEAAGFSRIRFVSALEKDARTVNLRRGIVHGYVD